MRLWPRRRVYVDDLPRTHDIRFLALFLVLFAGILGAVYVVGYLVVGDRVPAGTTVNDVSIGGLSREQAAALLRHRFATTLARPVTLRAGAERLSVSPTEAGVTLDVGATLDDAMQGAAWDPRHLLKVASGGGVVDPVFRVDQTRLAGALEPLAAKVAEEPVTSRVTILDGRVVVRAGRVGRRLEVPVVAATLTRGLADGARVIPLQPSEVHPALGVDAATRFASRVVDPALHGPVTLVVGHGQVRLTPSQFAAALRVDSSEGRLHLGIDQDALQARTRSVLLTLPGHPVRARIAFRDGRPVVVPSRAGLVVGPDAWAAAVLAATRSDERRAHVRSRTAQPGFTTADARALHIERLVGDATATAPLGSAGPLRLATRRLDGSVVLPGATFSLAQAVTGPGSRAVPSPLGSVTATAALRAQMAITRPPNGHDGDVTFRNLSNFPVYVRSWVGTPGPRRAPVVVQVWGSAGG